MSQASILVRGSPLTWRLTCSLSVGKGIIVGAHEVRVASTRSSSTMPRAPDHAGHHQRVGDYVILVSLYALYNLAVLVG